MMFVISFICMLNWNNLLFVEFWLTVGFFSA